MEVQGSTRARIAARAVLNLGLVVAVVLAAAANFQAEAIRPSGIRSAAVCRVTVDGPRSATHVDHRLRLGTIQIARRSGTLVA